MVRRNDEAFDRGMEGSESAARGWSEDERNAVRDAIELVAARGRDFTADDVWAALPNGFPVNKGMAAQLVAAKRRGLIVNTGRTTFCQKGGAHDHSQRLTVWAPVRGEEPVSQETSQPVADSSQLFDNTPRFPTDDDEPGVTLSGRRGA